MPRGLTQRLYHRFYLLVSTGCDGCHPVRLLLSHDEGQDGNTAVMEFYRLGQLNAIEATCNFDRAGCKIFISNSLLSNVILKCPGLAVLHCAEDHSAEGMNDL